MPDRPNHLLCFGFGFSARALAQALPRDQWAVTGTSRSAEGCAKIAQLGFDAALFNDDTPLDQSVLDRATHIVVSAPPGKAGDPVLLAHGPDLARRAARIKWLAYLSTTGVYGDRQGGWVDESSPQDVVAYAADLLGVEPPPEVAFEEADLSDMARSFYAESKRVSNDKVKSELGYRFIYPTYREGLKALL